MREGIRCRRRWRITLSRPSASSRTIEIVLSEEYATSLNPLGIKGAGESGINAVGATLAAAIDNAIGIPGAITQLPVTPQRLKAILKRRGRSMQAHLTVESWSDMDARAVAADSREHH